MIPIVYLLTCMAFYAAFVRLDVVGQSIALFGGQRATAEVMADGTLSDLENETRIRRAAVDTLKDTFGYFGRLVILLLLTSFPVVFTAAMAGLDVDAFVVFTLNPGIRQARIRKVEMG